MNPNKLVARIRLLLATGHDVALPNGQLLARENRDAAAKSFDSFRLKPWRAGKRGRTRYAMCLNNHVLGPGQVLVREPGRPGEEPRWTVRRRARNRPAPFGYEHLNLFVTLGFAVQFYRRNRNGRALEELRDGDLLDGGELTRRGERVLARLVRVLERECRR